jgi:iron complex transport system ATP-binding protein
MNLIATDVVVRFPGRDTVAVDAASLSVRSGELVAIAGPNGSGKTTLLRAMLGLVAPDTGEVTLDGRPLARWSRRHLARQIGALPQREEPVFPLRSREAVLLGRWAGLGPMSRVTAEDESAVAQALQRCDASAFAERTIDTLSGGEWQRVRLARALVSAPALLLLDEPTAALDLHHEMALLELLRTLANDGLGVLVVSHQLNLVARFADRIVLLDHGRVAADGPPREVLTVEQLTRVFFWPVAVEQWHGIPQIVALSRRDDSSHR